MQINSNKKWPEVPPSISGYNITSLKKMAKEYGIQILGQHEKVDRDTKITGKCLECNDTWEKGFRPLVNNGGPFCKKHMNERKSKKREQTTLATQGVVHHMLLPEMKEKVRMSTRASIGVDYPLQNKEIQEKSKQTLIKNFGVDNPSRSEEIKEKRRHTCLDEYGTEYPSQNEDVKEKIVQTNLKKRGVKNPNQSEEVKAKTVQTNLMRRNVRNPGQCKKVQQKMRATNMKKRNVPYTLQDPIVRKKIKQALIENLGVDNPMKSEQVKEKVLQTVRKRFNVDNPMQNGMIMRKQQRSAFSRKKYILPSGSIVEYQGYENFTWEFLLSTMKLSEDEVMIDDSVPKIKWIDSLGKSHIYSCDHFIPSKNLLIETKSRWTFENEEENNLLKQKFAKEAGYKHQIFIWNQKGEIEDIID